MAPSTCSRLLVATVFACGAVSAEAQTTGRPYQSLFGPDSRDVARPDQFTVALSAYAGLDDTSRFATGGVLDDSLQTDRKSTRLNSSHG